MSMTIKQIQDKLMSLPVDQKNYELLVKLYGEIEHSDEITGVEFNKRINKYNSLGLNELGSSISEVSKTEVQLIKDIIVMKTNKAQLRNYSDEQLTDAKESGSGVIIKDKKLREEYDDAVKKMKKERDEAYENLTSLKDRLTKLNDSLVSSKAFINNAEKKLREIETLISHDTDATPTTPTAGAAAGTGTAAAAAATTTVAVNVNAPALTERNFYLERVAKQLKEQIALVRSQVNTTEGILTNFASTNSGVSAAGAVIGSSNTSIIVSEPYTLNSKDKMSLSDINNNIDSLKTLTTTSQTQLESVTKGLESLSKKYEGMQITANLSESDIKAKLKDSTTIVNTAGAYTTYVNRSGAREVLSNKSNIRSKVSNNNPIEGVHLSTGDVVEFECKNALTSTSWITRDNNTVALRVDPSSPPQPNASLRNDEQMSRDAFKIADEMLLTHKLNPKKGYNTLYIEGNDAASCAYLHEALKIRIKEQYGSFDTKPIIDTSGAPAGHQNVVMNLTTNASPVTANVELTKDAKRVVEALKATKEGHKVIPPEPKPMFNLFGKKSPH